MSYDLLSAEVELYMYVRSNRNRHRGCKIKPTNFLILHCKFSFIVLVYSPISLHREHRMPWSFLNIKLHIQTHYKLWSESRHDDDCDAQRSINLSPAGSGNLQNVNIFSLKLSVANKSIQQFIKYQAMKFQWDQTLNLLLPYFGSWAR